VRLGKAGQRAAEKLTITLDATVYDELSKVIGRRRISRFIEEVARPHLLA
jgi:hypothetical protein